MAYFNGFKNDYIGLSSEEVKHRKKEYGLNQIKVEKKTTWFTKLIQTITEPMFLLLFGTAFLYFILGEPRDGFIMIFFVTVMCSINFVQEWRTDKMLQALKDLSDPKVRVIRNGLLEIIESVELTVDDLMVIEEGDKVSADGIILEMFDLGIDESTLTGESEIVWKKIYNVDSSSNDTFRRDVVYSGTMVTQGSAVVKVTAIGTQTVYGKIGVDILSVQQDKTPLEKQIGHLIKVCALIGVGLFILVFIITLLGTNDLIQSILSGITLAMGMIPEEFPVILTVFLAMGAWRLAKKQALIRRMPSVETLGSVSVLCVDKTGTLTMNQMTVQEVFNFNHSVDNEYLHNVMGLSCETEPYDPMEKAILSYIVDKGINKNDLFNKELVSEYPFSSESKMMGHIWNIDNKNILTAKGSPESIIPLCELNESESKEVHNELYRLASNGYRVIAVAVNDNMIEIPNNLSDNKLKLLGLIGLEDPARNEVMEAIKTCNEANIRVVMITGDNGITAKSIAKKIDIQHSENIITGHDLETLNDEELRERVKDTNIFARVIPHHKMRIVKALKENGEIVAMSGDGVNDAPALKLADIGIAMGKRGTGVAKEAADMILLDDNFTTIVETIHDGRRIYDNIKKAVGYVFVIHIPIALLALLAPMFNLPLLLLPIHVVLLELIIDPTCSIVFERQPAEANIMTRRPRKINESLVSKQLLIKSIAQGLIIFLAAFIPYFYLVNEGVSVDKARGLSLLILALSNLFLVYVNRFDNELVYKSLFKFKDKVIWIINSVIIFALVLIIYTPFCNNLVKTEPLDFNEVLVAILIALIATGWYEIVKVYKKAREANFSKLYTKDLK